MAQKAEVKEVGLVQGGGRLGAPGAVSGAPGGVSGAPGAVSGAPGGVSGAPGGVSGAPGGVSGAPGGVSGAPGAVGGAPTAVGGAPTAGGGVVVAVREKKGPLRAAIPTMPFPLAVICLFLNTFIPGLGTLMSAFSVLCGAHSELVGQRGVCCVFWLNMAAALIQMVTAVIVVGWIMSIFWGMDMVILAISDGYRDQSLPQDV